MSEVGELQFLSFCGELKFEWKVKEFLSYGNLSYVSPQFYFSEILWRIRLYPYGESCNGVVSIYIEPNSITESIINSTFSLHLKTVDGKLDTDAKYTDNKVFQKQSLNGSSGIISRSRLVERKSELLPGGVLTVIFTFKLSDTSVETAGSATIREVTKMEGDTDVPLLQQHWKEMFQNGTFSDVILKVCDLEFKCHRCVLARSPVFLAMMTHEMKEKNTGVVDIQDDDSNTFSDFLHYLYTGSKEVITLNNVLKLYTVADKYQVDGLKKSCLDYMLKNISVDNFCDVLSLSLIHVEKDLTDACSQFYIKNSLSIMITPKWLQFMVKYPVAANELNMKQMKSNMKIKN